MPVPLITFATVGELLRLKAKDAVIGLHTGAELPGRPAAADLEGAGGDWSLIPL